MDTEPVAGNTAPTIFGRMEDGHYAKVVAEERIEEIFGVELLGIGFDTYDGSFEIYFDREVPDVAPSEEQHASVMALGCSRYWISFPDGAERYGRGERKAAAFKRWESFNLSCDQTRRATLDAARYQWLRESLRSKATMVRAQAMFWNHTSRKALDKAIDAAIAAGGETGCHVSDPPPLDSLKG